MADVKRVYTFGNKEAEGNGKMRENSAEIKARQPRGGNCVINPRKRIITAVKPNAAHTRIKFYVYFNSYLIRRGFF